MNCEQCKNELVDLVKDELSPGLRREVEAHLAGCAACRRERQVVEQTFATLARELVPIELSAHFRMALAEKLEQATVSPPGADGRKTGSSSSARHLRDLRRPVVLRLWDHARRSPYFAASLLLHAAALLVICAAVVKLQAQKAEIVTLESRGHAGRNVSAAPSPLLAAYLARKDAHRISTRAERVSDGLRVDLSQLYIMERRELVLVPDRELHCVRGYFADTDEKGFSKTQLLQRFPGAVPAVVARAEVVLPARMQSCLAPGLDLYVFRLNDRLEFWSRPAWKRLSKRFAGVLSARGAGFAPRCSGGGEAFGRRSLEGHAFAPFQHHGFTLVNRLLPDDQYDAVHVVWYSPGIHLPPLAAG